MFSPLQSHLSPDIFLHVPASLGQSVDGGNRGDIPRSNGDQGIPTDLDQSHNGSRQPLNVVFFITGNPGLVGYYRPFLAGLVASLELEPGLRERVVVAGFSLGGFEVESHHAAVQAPASGESEALRTLLFPDGGAPKRVYSLSEQVELCYARVEALVRRLRRQCSLACRRREQGAGLDASPASGQVVDDGGSDDVVDVDIDVNVTLIGHSVGAYLALEVVRLRDARSTPDDRGSNLREGRDADWELDAVRASSSPAPPSRGGLTKQSGRRASHARSPWAVTSAILLTPTIQDLHLSASGRIAEPLLRYAPFIPALAHGLVQTLLVKCLPGSWLEGLVQRATGMERGSHGLETTVSFLQSETGVRQALEMARCELQEIRGEIWGAEVWGVTHQAFDGELDDGGAAGCTVENPKLFLWFAKQDHWVADATRNEILRRRGHAGVLDRDRELDLKDGLESEDDGVTKNGKLLIRIDETEGLVHAWCLTQSELVICRVSRWLKDRWTEEGYGGRVGPWIEERQSK